MPYDPQFEQMNNAYKDLERQFVELSYVIPLKNKPDTYSPRLYNILQSACGQIENMSRMICDKLEVLYEKPNFPNYYKALNSDKMLEKQVAYLVQNYQTIGPFKIESDVTPNWWKNYNDTKHDLPSGFLQGNLGNTIEALAALYQLQRIAYFVQYDPDPRRLLRQEKWNVSGVADARDPLTRQLKSFEPQGMIHSVIFTSLTFYVSEESQEPVINYG
ncbi:MAG TPA: hypothetical protein VFA69_01245 [Candidatus Nitrosotalea sp.]|nr:hypothetical protein [Candidatus Nitrosotalea sp.]